MESIEGAHSHVQTSKKRSEEKFRLKNLFRKKKNKEVSKNTTNAKKDEMTPPMCGHIKATAPGHSTGDSSQNSCREPVNTTGTGSSCFYGAVGDSPSHSSDNTDAITKELKLLAITLQIHSSDDTAVVTLDNVLVRYECPVCFENYPLAEFPKLLAECSHSHPICTDCWQTYLKLEISCSRIDISCPYCPLPMCPDDIYLLLRDSPEYLSKYETFMVRSVLMKEKNVIWCPAPDCGYAVIVKRSCKKCPRIECGRPGCETSICYFCKEVWHEGKPCDEPPVDLVKIGSSIVDLNRCPRCKVSFVRCDEECDLIKCTICHIHFCHNCMREANYWHQLSPSMCSYMRSFADKKKAKKILRKIQISAMVSGPVTLPLITALSAPLIMFTVPAIMAMIVDTGCEQFKIGKRKSVALIALGAAGGAVISPLVLALTLPALMTYVYGLTPYHMITGKDIGSKGIVRKPNTAAAIV